MKYILLVFSVFIFPFIAQATELVTGEQVRAAIIQAMAAGDMEADPYFPATRKLAACAQELAVKPRANERGVKDWRTVEVSCPDKGGWRIFVRTGYKDKTVTGFSSLSKKEKSEKAMVEVIILARKLRKDQLITKEHLAHQKIIARYADNGFTHIETLIGRRANRNLREGTMIKATHLQPDYLVFQNQAVEIFAGRQDYTISVAGVALQHGTLGDVVKVRNLSTRNEIYAFVIGEKKVAIKLNKDDG